MGCSGLETKLMRGIIRYGKYGKLHKDIYSQQKDILSSMTFC